MKSIVKFVILITFLSACSNNARKDPISKFKDYQEELEKFAEDSTRKLDTAAINIEFFKTDFLSISKEELKEIANEDDFKDLLRTEKDLLDRWEPIEAFKSYAGRKPDTLLPLNRRCSSFDRAPNGAGRLPSAWGLRTFSLQFYEVVVPVAFHIIINRNRAGLQGNMVTRINDQINALNAVYSNYRITFKLISIDTTTNDDWFNRASYYTDSFALKAMTSALSKNPAQVMNVYTLGSQRVLGEASFPWYADIGTSMDYIVVNYNTLPGGPSTYFNGIYNQGKTLVHEAGHFLGLWHTFEGGEFDCRTNPPFDGCSIGDQVGDTPSQQVCYFDGCDENSDSCPAPGNDPVRNYMGYNPDACMTIMTRGQGDRLLQCIIKYRYNLVVNRI